MYILEQLKIFAAVCRHGSFSAAARTLGRAQSGISQTIANLEIKFNQTLFQREKGAVTLTEHGRALLPAAEITAALTAAGYRDIHDLDLDDAVWEADATNAQGQRVELRLNAHTGKVLSEAIDD